MRLDEYQQAVVDCNRNAVVSAGAGSGKTTVLSARFLRLISEGRASVSEILTLTFTRKAAAEMYERIYGILLKNRDNSRVADAVNEFEKANISTLDSFCGRIARDCSTLFGLPSGFRTDEKALKRLAEEASLDFILENKDDPTLAEFIYLNGFENVWKNYFVYISMNYLSIGRPVDFTAMFERQMKTAEAELEKLCGRVRGFVAEILSFESELKGVVGVQDALRAFSPDDFSPGAEAAELRKNLALLDVRKPGGRSSDPGFVRCKEIIDELRPAVESIREILGTLEGRDLIKALFRITGSFQQDLFMKKRTAGLLGFHDVLTMAVEGLKKSTTLRRFYKGMFRYIMIDEFQDNNSLQKELLYLLSEADGAEGEGVPDASALNPEKLFFVGDEKQSIYLFRGADVSVFKQLSGELASGGGEALSLKRNYRSEPGLIEHFNDVFRHVMRDSELDFQAAFEPLEARDAALPCSPEIRLLYKPYDEYPADDALSSDEAEAWALADYIKESVGRLDVGGRGGVRKAEYSDFALLFRSGTNQKSYEKVFRANGIPYTVHSIRSLFQESPVNDIYSFLQICLYPEDRSASAVLLRSPLVNLSDLSVVRLLQSGQPVFAEGQQSCCVTEADAGKYGRAKELWDDICSRIDREPLADLISDIWFRSGYRFMLLADGSLHGYLEYYDYLRELAVRADIEMQSVAEFLDYIRENLGEYMKVDDLRIHGYSSGGVQMMPVHQSKGLEFPVTIIANAGNTGVNDRRGSEPAYISAADGLSFNLVDDSGAGGRRRNFFYSRGKEEVRAREEAELRRLLYVALTRAENHLVVSGCHGRQNRRGQRSMLNMFLSAFGWAEGSDPGSCPGLSDILTVIPSRSRHALNSAAGGTVDIAAASRYYRGAEPAVFSLSSDEYSASGLNSIALEARPAHPSGGRELALLDPELERLLIEESLEAAFGTLCHRLIEYRLKRVEGPLASGLFPAACERLKAGEKELMLREAERLADVFFRSELWETASSAVSFESELPFTARREQDGKAVTVKGVIDLVFETEDSVHVVDFKTDRHLVPGEYDTQMTIYLDAAGAIYGKPALCSLFYLRDGAEVRL